jgi:hypothetical protein
MYFVLFFVLFLKEEGEDVLLICSLFVSGGTFIAPPEKPIRSQTPIITATLKKERRHVAPSPSFFSFLLLCVVLI